MLAEDDETPITVLKDDKEVTELENVQIDDTGKAIVKVKLRKKSDEDYKKQQEALKDDKQARLFLKVTCQGDDRKHKKLFLEEEGFVMEKEKCYCSTDFTFETISKIFNDASDEYKKGILNELNKSYTVKGESKKLYKIFELDTCLKRAHFFAQARVESSTNLKGAFNGESLNYSIKALVSGYPFLCFKSNAELTKKAYEIGRGPYTYKRSVKKMDPNTKKEVTVEETIKIPSSQKADQKAIANIAYDDANRSKSYKLGNTQKGDGWKFRGRGLLQTTGRYNYTKTQSAINEILPNSGVTLNNGSEKFTAKEVVFAGLGEWIRKKSYVEAEKGKADENVDNVTKKINKETESYEDRKKAFRDMEKIFNLNNCQ